MTTSPNYAGGSIKDKITNPDLLEERAKCTFDQREMEVFFFSKEVAELTDDLVVECKKHPEMTDLGFEWYDMTREERHEYWIKKWNIMSSINREKYITDIKIANNWWWAYYFMGFSPLHLHHTMFKKTIENLGSEKQVADLIPRCNNLTITGCYAQTELGHGSDVSRLETTATFDNEA
jgi:acyl-CoA oxidase